MWRSLETSERRVFSESVYPFRAEPLKIYSQYTRILFILQYNLQKKNAIQFNENKKIMETSLILQ
jgi:hypothetical protein